MEASKDQNHLDVENHGGQENWKWVRWETRALRPFLNFGYRSKIWNVIKSRLVDVGDQELLGRFRCGCFGHLLDWRNNNSSGWATHAVVARQVIVEGSEKHAMWFRVLGQNLRFSFKEYSLVTGFLFGRTEFNPTGWHDPTNVGVYQRFAGSAKVSTKELLLRFVNGMAGASEDDYLKVANLLALHMFVLGYDIMKIIEDFAWVLVDNLDEWNTFPWGSYTYQTLMHYVFQVARTKEECQTRYHSFGPVWALKMWSYEAIPDLAAAAAELDRPNHLPRCLRWAFKKPTVKNFHHYFNRQIKRRCLQTLTPNDNEKCKDYWISVTGPDPVGVEYDQPFNESTARVRIDGPIRKYKLIQRAANSASQQRGGEDGMIIDRFSELLENGLKEWVHEDAMKTIFNAWGRATLEGSTDDDNDIAALSQGP